MGGLFYVLAIFLIGGFFIAGYMMELIRRSAAGEPYPLPEWENLGDMFVEGAQVLVVYLAFIVPLIVMYLVPLVAMALLSESGEPPAAMGFVVVLFMLFVALMYVALLLYFPAAVIRMAIERRISAAFEFSDNFEFIKRNIVNFLLAILIYMLASFVAQFGMIFFCVGIFPAAFWGVCVGAYSFGEVVLRDPGRSPQPERPDVET